MNNKNLVENLNTLGYPLLEVEKAVDANATLAAVAKSHEVRLLEGFPVALANSAQKKLLDLARLNKLVGDGRDYSFLEHLELMSLALYKNLKVRSTWAKELDRFLSGKQHEKLLNYYLKHFKNNTDFKLFDTYLMSSQRLKKTFNTYFYGRQQSNLRELLSLKDEFGLEYALSQVFTAKQKELFFKKVRNEKLTKTEKEYFSRVVKKKVVALADEELHRLARKLLK